MLAPIFESDVCLRCFQLLFLKDCRVHLWSCLSLIFLEIKDMMSLVSIFHELPSQWFKDPALLLGGASGRGQAIKVGWAAYVFHPKDQQQMWVWLTEPLLGWLMYAWLLSASDSNQSQSGLLPCATAHKCKPQGSALFQPSAGSIKKRQGGDTTHSTRGLLLLLLSLFGLLCSYPTMFDEEVATSQITLNGLPNWAELDSEICSKTIAEAARSLSWNVFSYSRLWTW